MKLKDIAYVRTGDKGDTLNISVVLYNEEYYQYLKEYLTASKVKEYYSEICLGKVTRYDLDNISALNFVMEKSLGGGVTRSLAVDKHGKSLGMALLEIDIK